MSFGEPVYFAERPPRRAGEVLDALLRAKRFYERKRYGVLVEAWRLAVGEQIAEHTRIGAFDRGRLVVEVDSPVLLQELRGFMEGAILEQLRAAPGGAEVAELRFRLGCPGGED